MEKYKKYTDHATGINPFVPLKPARQASGIVSFLFIKAPRLLLGILLAAIRLPIVLCLLLLLWVVTLPFNIVPLGRLGALITRPVYFVFCRLILLVLGFWWISSRTAVVKNKVVRRPDRKGSSGLGAGDILISNHVSYVELFYYAFKYSPQFTLASSRHPKHVQVVGFFQMLFATLSQSVASEATIPLQQALKNASSPLLVFPEGCTSNGKGLMRFTDVFADFRPVKRGHPQTQVTLVQYPFSAFSPTFPVGSGIGHLFWLSSQVYNKMEVKSVSSSDMPSLDEETTPDWAAALRDVMANSLRVQKIADLTVQNKAEFLKFWNQKQKGYKSS